MTPLPADRALLVLAVSFSIAAALPCRAQAAPPAISFVSETCDLGSVVQGEQPDCLFRFANAGGEPLRVLEVEPSCGCTTALLSAPLLHPGEQGGIRVVFDSDNFAGEVVKEIEVRSDDPARPALTLRVKALVEPEIDFEPRAVTFEAAGAGVALKQAVVLTNRKAGAVLLRRVTAQPSSYHCRVPDWVDPSTPLRIESWDRVPLEVTFTHPARLAMAVAGECTLEIEGLRKRHFRVKLLALPAP